MPSPNNTTYRVEINGRRYSYISMGKRSLNLKKTNSRKVKCGECVNKIEPQQGVWHAMYRGGNYFIHLRCARALIHKYGSKNYRENILGGLESGLMEKGPFTAETVIEGIAKFTFETNPEGIDLLTPA